MSRKCAVMAGSVVVALVAAGITFQNANVSDDVPQFTVRTLTPNAAGKLATALGDGLPPSPAAGPAFTDAASGRGLLLVEAYADRWGCTVRDPFTKTVWAEVTCSP
ncbi:ATP-binding protein [Streptomyces sp. NPDC057582]|uniref:ATP-binding protein n=1 Tax=Streptomyces sp. NPDC057582 TaxID=3346174 RepID=UPI003694F03D